MELEIFEVNIDSSYLGLSMNNFKKEKKQENYKITLYRVIKQMWALMDGPHFERQQGPVICIVDYENWSIGALVLFIEVLVHKKV